ncbi:MAG TPA: hypothetical protein PKL30_13710 [Leptospiraceae bacterium]|nr:hypothetical protein [Leptospiraceae bacterium]HNB98982.1 hypothetical protein [Leptospiraceae bacterium]HNC59228.1 hypothetical protein [Leptospiraceae bacterium]HNF54316.1 hypothetical protein [Leptospiraceae bacterium]HNH54434.1 hypothetical protein [Leptospiraceae bacterium]
MKEFFYASKEAIQSLSFGILLLFLFNCSTPWYRTLPNEELPSTRNFFGVWKKKTNSRAAINSSWHKNQWSESIYLRSDFTFTKVYEASDLVGREKHENTVIGKGVFKVNGNWILLETKSIFAEKKLNGVIEKKEERSQESALLYYYSVEGNLIIPMIYDMGYKEKDFGVKDGVSKPFDDKNPNFFQYIKIYAFKEFQSHAYYPEN